MAMVAYCEIHPCIIQYIYNLLLGIVVRVLFIYVFNSMHQQLASEFKKRTGARNIEAIQTTFTAFFQHDVPSSAKAVFQQKDEWEAEEVLCELFQVGIFLLAKCM